MKFGEVKVKMNTNKIFSFTSVLDLSFLSMECIRLLQGIVSATFRIRHLPLMSAFSNRTQITFSFSSVGGAPVYALSLKDKKVEKN